MCVRAFHFAQIDERMNFMWSACGAPTLVISLNCSHLMRTKIAIMDPYGLRSKSYFPSWHCFQWATQIFTHFYSLLCYVFSFWFLLMELIRTKILFYVKYFGRKLFSFDNSLFTLYTLRHMRFLECWIHQQMQFPVKWFERENFVSTAWWRKYVELWHKRPAPKIQSQNVHLLSPFFSAKVSEHRVYFCSYFIDEWDSMAMWMHLGQWQLKLRK